MFLKLIVLVGLAIYLATEGEWILAVISVVALWPKFGLHIAIFLTAFLGLSGKVWPAIILGGLIVWNIAGNHYFSQKDEKGNIK